MLYRSRGFVAEVMQGYYGPKDFEHLLPKAGPPTVVGQRTPEVLALRQKGLSYLQIGAELGITQRQVEHVMIAHRQRN